QDVRRMLLERLEGGDAVSGLGDHRELGPERSEERGELFAQQRLVLGYDGARGWQGGVMIASRRTAVTVTWCPGSWTWRARSARGSRSPRCGRIPGWRARP